MGRFERAEHGVVAVAAELDRVVGWVQPEYPLGAGVEAAPTTGHESEIIKALNAHARFLRGRLGPKLDMKFTPDLKFRHDESFDAASRIDRLFADPRVRADLEASDDEDDQ